MSRRPRVFAPGLLYHVIVRGNQRRKTFRCDDDYKAYLDRLERYRAKCHVRIYAYCLMPNHVHLLVETGSTPLAKFMQGLQQSYTQHFNRSYRKVGHLFQGRYKAIICDRDKYLLALVRYIHLNPVRAKLVTRPERYSYSGHNSYLTNGTAKIVEVTPILKLLGGKKAYERFVLEGLGGNHNEAYYAVEDQRFLGEQGFGEAISRGTEQNEERRAKKPIETTFREIARRVETTPGLLRGRDRRWDISTKRAEAVALLVWEYGYAVSEVAKYLGRDQANISTMLSRLSARETERSR
ncbi:MAG: transposase [Deltaproteobacteria bacterium]|nr:transposase [Deltaproteobacteria bacterium]MBI2531207.1 transposase [Deltaproteobacteria bacterium]